MSHSPSELAEIRIRELLLRQHSKAALEAAKQLHKDQRTPGSESLLIEAYRARIGDLLKHGMATEARALLDLVLGRFPAAGSRLADLVREMCLRNGDLDGFVAPLEDPMLSRAAREEIESTIRKRVFDLNAVSQAQSLASDHPLRLAADVLGAALAAATTGPVASADLALPEVSRRSPLASWKALIHAVAAFYRADDHACRRWLQALEADSAPARLVPAFDVLLGSNATASLRPAAKKLVAAIGGGEAFRAALPSLEAAFQSNKRQAIVERVRSVASDCERFCPQLREKLRRYVSVRWMAQGFPPDPIFEALGGAPLRDARWYQMLATAKENSSRCDHGSLDALIAWQSFADRALEEGWFKANSPEQSVVLLHMAKLAARLPADMVSRRESPGRQSISVEALYQRAAAADPHLEVFESWLAWAKRQGDWRVAERAAEAWHQARKRDVQPLLWLMDASEKRGAYRKSLKYLEEAEQLDRVNPEVRKAKLRLQVAAVLRHFRQRKLHLALAGIERLAALSDLDAGWAALVTALRRVCAALEHDPEASGRYALEVQSRLGNPAAAYLLEQSILDGAVLVAQDVRLQGFDASSCPPATLLTGLVDACILSDAAGLRVSIPGGWEAALKAALAASELELDIAGLLVVGEAAIASAMRELAFAASIAGLTRGGADSSFLYLRARALPVGSSGRYGDCLLAALEMARRERNTELAGKLLDLLRRRPRRMFDLDELEGPDGALSPEQLQETMDKERAAKEFPGYEGFEEEDEFLDDEDEDEDLDAEGGFELPDIPMGRAARTALDEFMEFIEQLADNRRRAKPGSQSKPLKRGKSSRVAPEQGSFF
jgi:tetratricopeptide (TPR) repeat protein